MRSHCARAAIDAVHSTSFTWKQENRDKSSYNPSFRCETSSHVIYAYIHTYIHTHTHTYIDTHMHAYIHTYIHM
jgi:hypothetical protein